MVGLPRKVSSSLARDFAISGRGGVLLFWALLGFLRARGSGVFATLVPRLVYHARS